MSWQELEERLDGKEAALRSTRQERNALLATLRRHGLLDQPLPSLPAPSRPAPAPAPLSGSIPALTATEPEPRQEASSAIPAVEPLAGSAAARLPAAELSPAPAAAAAILGALPLEGHAEESQPGSAPPPPLSTAAAAAAARPGSYPVDGAGGPVPNRGSGSTASATVPAPVGAPGSAFGEPQILKIDRSGALRGSGESVEGLFSMGVPPGEDSAGSWGWGGTEQMPENTSRHSNFPSSHSDFDVGCGPEGPGRGSRAAARLAFTPAAGGVLQDNTNAGPLRLSGRGVGQGNSGRPKTPAGLLERLSMLQHMSEDLLS